MRRTSPSKEPDAILTSDWHIRETQPTCRTDDFWNTQWKKVAFVSQLQDEYNCPVLHAGDLFHHWKPSPYLLSAVMAALPAKFYTIYGQHDPPNHNLEESRKSGIHTLETAGALRVLDGCHWGQTPTKESFKVHIHRDASGDVEVRNILVWHVMNYQGKKPWPGAKIPMAAALLRKYKDYDLILTGDNHKPFTETFQGRLLVNPGSLTRQSADQIDHRPRVYLYYADDNTVSPVFLPVDPDVVVRDHIEEQEKKEKRITAFVSRLTDEWTTDLSFEANLEEFFRTNQVRKSVEKLTYKAIEDENH